MRALPIIQATTDYDRSLSRKEFTVLFLDFRVRIARPMPVQMDSMYRTGQPDAPKVIRNNAERCLCGLRVRGLAEPSPAAVVDLWHLRNPKMFQVRNMGNTAYIGSLENNH